MKVINFHFHIASAPAAILVAWTLKEEETEATKEFMAHILKI